MSAFVCSASRVSCVPEARRVPPLRSTTSLPRNNSFETRRSQASPFLANSREKPSGGSLRDSNCCLSAPLDAVSAASSHAANGLREKRNTEVADQRVSRDACSSCAAGSADFRRRAALWMRCSARAGRSQAHSMSSARRVLRIDCPERHALGAWPCRASCKGVCTASPRRRRFVHSDCRASRGVRNISQGIVAGQWRGRGSQKSKSSA